MYNFVIDLQKGCACMFPPRRLTTDNTFQVTERAYLSKAQPGLNQQFISVCLRLDDGSFAGFCYLDLDKDGVYRDGNKVLGKLDDPGFIEYIRKISAHPGEEDKAFFASVCARYSEIKSIKKTAKELSVSEERVRRILITEGLYTCDQHERIMELLREGKTVDEVGALINMKPKQIKTYLPYGKDFD